MLLFCPQCSNCLTVSRAPVTVQYPEGQNRLECKTCPYHFLLTDRYFERTHMKRKEVEDVMGGKDAWANVDRMDAQCPRDGCVGDKAFFYQVQIRSADEPMTTFLMEGSSPFTLIFDSLEQPALRLLRQYIGHARTSKKNVVFLGFETLRAPSEVDIFIKGRRKSPLQLQNDLSESRSKLSNRTTLLVIDTLQPLIDSLAKSSTTSIAPFLSSLIDPNTYLLATYHMDIFSHHGSRGSASTYEPNPFSLLTYLATTIFTVHAFSQTLARKRAADKSIGEPVFGLAEEIEGVLVGLGKKDDSFRGESKGQELVLEMEHRRKSGREVREWYVLTALSCSIPITITRRVKEKIILLDDHPLYGERDMDDTAEIDAEAGGEDITFNMGLTEKQKRDREGVVLPYLDAQKGEGGSGGRILYDMGVEDDFDEEEDEI